MRPPQPPPPPPPPPPTPGAGLPAAGTGAANGDEEEDVSPRTLEQAAARLAKYTSEHGDGGCCSAALPPHPLATHGQAGPNGTGGCSCARASCMLVTLRRTLLTTPPSTRPCAAPHAEPWADVYREAGPEPTQEAGSAEVSLRLFQAAAAAAAASTSTPPVPTSSEVRVNVTAHSSSWFHAVHARAAAPEARPGWVGGSHITSRAAQLACLPAAPCLPSSDVNARHQSTQHPASVVGML